MDFFGGEFSFLSHYIKGIYLPAGSGHLDVDPGYLADVCLSGASTLKAFLFSFSVLYTLGGGHCVPPTHKEWAVRLRLLVGRVSTQTI